MAHFIRPKGQGLLLNLDAVESAEFIKKQGLKLTVSFTSGDKRVFRNDTAAHICDELDMQQEAEYIRAELARYATEMSHLAHTGGK